MIQGDGGPETVDGMAGKRLVAGLLMLAGKPPAEAARAVGVARQTAYKWKSRLAIGGIETLRRMTNGRPPLLGADELRDLRTALGEGALAHGFPTNVWTTPQVRRLIDRVHGVEFSDAHVRRLLFAFGFGPAGRRLRATEQPPHADPVLTVVPRTAGTAQAHDVALRRAGAAEDPGPGLRCAARHAK